MSMTLERFSQGNLDVWLTATDDIGIVGSKGWSDYVFQVAVGLLTAFRLVVHATSRRIMPMEAAVYRTVRETITEISIEFIEELIAQLRARLPGAVEVAHDTCTDIHFPYALGQLRYFYTEAALKAAAEACGIPVDPRHINRLGGAFHVVQFPNIDLTCGVLQATRFVLKKSKYQKELASQNIGIDPPLLDMFDDEQKSRTTNSLDDRFSQPDLFSEVLVPSKNRISMSVVILHSQRRSSDLKFAGFGIQRSDLSGWIDIDSFDNILGRKIIWSKTSDTTPEVKDTATPTLKSQSDDESGKA